jgi:LacI family transcriptional regulator
MKRHLTIHDVARRTSLSISTISLVLNNKPHVSEETRRKVLQAIEELGYHPQRSARGLASQSSGNLGFIVTEDHFSQTEPFYTRIFLGTECEARDHNYYILLTTVSKHFSKTSTVPRFLLEKNVDGVIIAGKINEKLIDYIEHLGIPIVLVDYGLKRKRISSILIDNRKGIREATEHLIQNGHRDIAFIGGDLTHPSIAERLEAFKETLREHNVSLKEEIIVVDETDNRIRNGYRAMEKLLKRDVRPSAVVAANDAMAIGCIQYTKTIGLKIPEDFSIVGFDDIEISDHIEPRLTTVRVHKEEMGKLAMRRLVEIVRSKTQTVVTVHVPVELIVRESTRSLNASMPQLSATL